MNAARPPVDLTRCPQCKGKIIREKCGTGLMTYHVLGNKETSFLCPDPVPVVKTTPKR